MTTEQRIEELYRWKDTMEDAEEYYRAMDDLIGIYPGDRFFGTFYGLLSELTRLTSIIVGDQHEWLNWFRDECRFGANPLEVEFECKEYRVETPRDLCHVIEETSNLKQ